MMWWLEFRRVLFRSPRRCASVLTVRTTRSPNHDRRPGRSAGAGPGVGDGGRRDGLRRSASADKTAVIQPETDSAGLVGRVSLARLYRNCHEPMIDRFLQQP